MSSQVWPIEANQKPMDSSSGIVAISDAAYESGDEGHGEGGAAAPLRPGSASGKATPGSLKRGISKRVYIPSANGDFAERCGSIHDSLETSRNGLVRPRPRRRREGGRARR